MLDPDKILDLTESDSKSHNQCLNSVNFTKDLSRLPIKITMFQLSMQPFFNLSYLIESKKSLKIWPIYKCFYKLQAEYCKTIH